MGNIFDNTMIILIVGSFIIQLIFNKIEKKYLNIDNLQSINGIETAVSILNHCDINDVWVSKSGKQDYFAPKTKELHLSCSTADTMSITAVAIAAHECGHAIYHHKKEITHTIRMYCSYMRAIISCFTYILVFMYWFTPLLTYERAMTYILITCFVELFSQLFIIPSEIKASKCGLQQIKEIGLLADDEIKDAKKVLFVAGATYVYAATSLLAQTYLIYLFLSNFGGMYL